MHEALRYQKLIINACPGDLFRLADHADLADL